MNEIEEEMRQLEEQLVSQSKERDLLSEKKTDAEDKYNDMMSAEENYSKQLEFMIDELYTKILTQEAGLETLNKEYELKKYLLKIEQIKFGLGRSSHLKLDQMSIDMVNLNSQLVEQKNSLKSIKGKLNDMMGRAYDAELKLASFEILKQIEIPEVDALFSSAIREYNVISELERDIDKKEDDLDDAEDEDEYYQCRLLELDIDAMELQLEDEKYKLYDSITNLIIDIKNKQATYELLVANFEKAKKNYDWAKKRYEIGQISKLDLIQSELDYLNMKDNMASAEYNLYLATRSLELAEDGIIL